ncbi:MAG: HDOD domain-containing protein [Pseudomonadales bacterium]|nr:HDOD domain-containing protein [Pseudomonadales bacterium]
MSEKLVEAVRNDLIQAIKKDEIKLPTLPEVALQIRTEAKNPDVSAARLTKVIGQDVGLSARLIKVANSPLMRGSKTIENLQMAISRIGVAYAGNLATGIAMQQMYQASSPSVDEKMREIWSRSTEVAGIAYILAKHYTNLRPDEASLAGLVHRIGALPILTYLEDQPKLNQNQKAMDFLLLQLQGEIGQLILETWDFPAELIPVPSKFTDFARESDGTDYVDIVMVANLQSYLGSDHPYTKLDWSAIPAFSRLGLDPDAEEQEAEDISAEMEAAMAMFD